MILLNIRAQNVDAVIAGGYSKIYVYRDTDPEGMFTENIGNITLVPGQEYYDFTDISGVNHYYKIAYFNAAPEPDGSLSAMSAPFRGVPANGPMNLLTPSYVKGATNFQELANLPDSKVAMLIQMAEGFIYRFGQPYGGYNTGLADYEQQMTYAALWATEQFFLKSRPEWRRTSAYGFVRERIGTYEYSRGTILNDSQTLVPGEILDLLMFYVAGSRNAVSVTSTRVFLEYQPMGGPPVSTRPWHDLLDDEVSYNRNLGQRVPD